MTKNEDLIKTIKLIFDRELTAKQEALLDKALANQRKAILEEVREKIIGEDVVFPDFVSKELVKEVIENDWSNNQILIEYFKNKLRAEQRQKLSILEGTMTEQQIQREINKRGGIDPRGMRSGRRECKD